MRERALHIAQAEFVYDLPWGLDTRLGEQGLTLSGGQRQRLALARAVLGRPLAVLVLDDLLLALDVHTEALVERALRRGAARNTTALVVAHRASTVLLADRVAVLVGGTLAAVGTHSEPAREGRSARTPGGPAGSGVLDLDGEVATMTVTTAEEGEGVAWRRRRGRRR